MKSILKFLKKAGIVLLMVAAVLFIYTLTDKSPSPDSTSQELKEWQESAETFEHGGYKLSYHDTKEGQKEALVMLHGYPTSSFDWHLVWGGLSENYRLIAFDALGFGFSDKPGGIDYSIAQQADILEALLVKLGVEEVHLLAHDYGDNVAQELLARDGERGDSRTLKLKSVVMLNGALFPETHHLTQIQSLLNGPFGVLVSALTNQTLFEKSFKKVFGAKTQPSPQLLTDLWYLICLQNGHKINHKLMHVVDERKEKRERWVPPLSTTEVPLLLLNGLLDPVSGGEMVNRFKELVPDPHVVELESAGHYPHLERPTEVVVQVKEFLRSLEPAPLPQDTLPGAEM